MECGGNKLGEPNLSVQIFINNESLYESPTGKVYHMCVQNQEGVLKRIFDSPLKG